MLRRTKSADLTGVECRAARSEHTECSRRFSDRIKSFYVRLPILIHADPAVAVLCADGNPKRLIFEIDPVLAVEFDRARVHLFQPFDRQRNERIGIFKIIIRGLIQLAKPVFSPFGSRVKSIYTLHPFTTVSRYTKRSIKDEP